MRLIISKLDTILISKQEAAMQGVTTFEFEDLRCRRYAYDDPPVESHCGRTGQQEALHAPEARDSTARSCLLMLECERD